MKNIWNKLSSFVERFHKNKIFIAFLIIFTVAITIFNYDFLTKDSIIYPSAEYDKFETLVLEHFKKIKDGTIEEVPSNIDYNLDINKKKINAKYTATTEIPFFEVISIETSQILSNEEIELTRSYTENNYINLIRFMWGFVGFILGIFISFIFSMFCYIIRFINWIINKVSNKEKNVKKDNTTNDLTTLEKAAKYFQKHKENQDNS